MLTRNICSEYGANNIQCNGIGPGYIATPQTAPLREKQADGSRHPFDQFICGRTPAGRWLQAEELTGPAVFLASDASNAVNGHILYMLTAVSLLTSVNNRDDSLNTFFKPTKIFRRFFYIKMNQMSPNII